MGDFIARVKRECLLCCTYKNFHDKDDRRQNVVDLLDRAYRKNNEKYNEFRKLNKSVELINAAYANKKHCLDLIGACKACDKETDRVNRELNLAPLEDD